jgi:hypothetical protein
VRPLLANGIANKAVSTALGNIVNTLRAVGATVVPVDDACIGHVPGLGRGLDLPMSNCSGEARRRCGRCRL